MDRQFIARELGFIGGVCPNSMDAVSDRDYVLDTLYFVAVHMTHLSRWAEDLIIYSSGLFKFVQCSDAYATGAHACRLPGLPLLYVDSVYVMISVMPVAIRLASGPHEGATALVLNLQFTFLCSAPGI